MSESKLVVGAGATGRTHQLKQWVTNFDPDGEANVVWLTGSPLRAVTIADVSAAIDSAPSLLVADDVQWFEADALQSLIEMVEDILVFASRRPETGAEEATDGLTLLAEVLTRPQPATRLELLDVDRFASALAAIKAANSDGDGTKASSGDEVDALHELTGGSVGFAADVVAAGWDAESVKVPAGLTEAVRTRIRRAGPEAAELVEIWSVLSAEGGPESFGESLGLLTEGSDPDLAERSLRAGGLLVDDDDGMARLIPLVARATLADLTAAKRSAIHDRVAGTRATADPVSAAHHVLAGAGAVENAPEILAGAAFEIAVGEPGQADEFIEQAQKLGLPAHEGALLQALAAFHRGSPDALAHLQRAESSGEPIGDRGALLGYGIDLRDLRFEDAAQRPVTGDLADPMRSVAGALAGKFTELADDASRTSLGRLLATINLGVSALAAGETSAALGSFSTAVDDFDRLKPSAPFGMTPHAIGSLGALLVGNLSVVELLTGQAIEQRSGGIGEDLTHRLIAAYGKMIAAEYGPALDLVRQYSADEEGFGAGDGPDSGPGSATVSESAASDGTAAAPEMLCQRDRLLLAALEAGVARRSGDTGRLRAAWKRSEEALIRPSTSWLLSDFLVELLACGARLGDSQRVGPIMEALADQAGALSPNGPGPTAAAWLQLQVALAASDKDDVAAAAERLVGCTPSDTRSQARVAAGPIWAQVVEAAAAEADVVEVSALLSAAGDVWEASRLLGQAALDEQDPKAARRLLELARVSSVEQVDESTGEGLAALGLSDREAEVALLIHDGRTYKEVGAQLYISPKTVEHHVAKIRQKLGATSRAELLSIIREAAN